MDLLRSTIASTKNELESQKRPGSRWVYRSDIANAKENPIAEELAKKRADSNLTRVELLELVRRKAQDCVEVKAAESNSDEVPPIPVEEIQKKLRSYCAPIILFGETPAQMYQRLSDLQMSDQEEHGVIVEPQNLLLAELEGRKRKRHEFREEDGDGEKKLARLETPEERIRAWIRKILELWEHNLAQRTNEEKQSADGRLRTAIQRQTLKDLRPLRRRLKSGQIESDVVARLDQIVSLCDELRYVEAHDKYIEMAIGNAAWPMGVTCVGIHERAGHSKIATAQVAHILNDETTRKYIQMFKRLISYCQKCFPTDPSKMVAISTFSV